MKKVEVVIPQSLIAILDWVPTPEQRSAAITFHYLSGTEHYLIDGYLLCQAKLNEDWKIDGVAHNHYEWVEKEKGISRSNAQRLEVVWEVVSKFIDKRYNLIMQIDFSKLAEAASAIKKLQLSEDKAVDLLFSASENTVRDLHDNIRVLKGKTPTDMCDHISYEVFHKCKKCHKFLKIEGGENG